MDPIVVVDWGVLRQLPNNAVLRDDTSILIADTVFREIASSDNPQAFAVKLKTLLEPESIRARVCLGQYWDSLSRRESEPQKLVAPDEIIHGTMTEQLRELLTTSTGDWSERISAAAGAPEVREDERRRTAFVETCQAWTRWIRERQADELTRIGGDVPAQHNWIRIPHQVTEWIIQNNPCGKFDSPEWRAALSVFPDRHAVGRWARIIVWYCLMRSLHPTGDDHDFENNWDDAHYGFLASYTGRIATHDKGLKRLVAAVFPHVSMTRIEKV